MASAGSANCSRTMQNVPHIAGRYAMKIEKSLFVAGALAVMPCVAQAKEFAPLPGFHIGTGVGGAWYLSSTTSVGGSIKATSARRPATTRPNNSDASGNATRPRNFRTTKVIHSAERHRTTSILVPDPAGKEFPRPRRERPDSADAAHRSRKVWAIWSLRGFSRYSSGVLLVVWMKVSAGMPGTRRRPPNRATSSGARASRTE
jgi:hypothetical protein